MAALDYSALVDAVRDRLTERSAAHSEAVAKTAAEIAHAYGVDEAEARIAGLLHDWSRDESGPELIAAAREAGDRVAPADEEVPYLLHAKVGARRVAAEFADLPPAVIDAIAHHTVGGAGMAPLDMVVYVADMTEPGRDFDGVGTLRSMVGDVALEELYAEAYAMSLRHLIDRRKRLHPDTVAAWNSIVGRGQR